MGHFAGTGSCAPGVGWLHATRGVTGAGKRGREKDMSSGSRKQFSAEAKPKKQSEGKKQQSTCSEEQYPQARPAPHPQLSVALPEPCCAMCSL